MPSVLFGLIRRLAGSRGAFLFVILSSIALVVPGLLVPAFSRVFVDYYMIEGLKKWLWPLLVGMVAAAALRSGLTGLQQHFLLRLQTKLSITASSAFFWHVLRLPVGFFSQRYGGEIGTRVMFNDRIANLIAGDLGLTILNLVTMLLYGLIMRQYDPVLAAVGVGFAIFNLAAFGLVARRLGDANQRLLLDRGKMTGIAMQGLQMIDSYKASGTEGLFFTRWAGYHAKVVNVEQALSRYRAFLGVAPLLVSMLGTAAVLTVGGWRVVDGLITVGTLFAFQALLSSFHTPVASLVNLGAQMQEAQGYITRLEDIMLQEEDEEFKRGLGGMPGATVAPQTPSLLLGGNAPLESGKPDSQAFPSENVAAGAAEPPPIPPPRPPEPIKLTGRVSVKDLTFGFIPTDPPLVAHFSLDLEPGTRVALVGGSGSGKSTVGKLLAGLYRPWSGEILFDGMPMAHIPRDILRTSLAMVDQDIALFEGSVRDNISLWDTTMPEDRIVQAARDAMVHSEITERPDSYDFKVMESGRNFSGGQRQRIEIARALAGTPSILVLDEATSALDSATEKQVVDNIRRRGCTCIIIAHRLSTIRDCDEIIVLDRGKIIERGTHQALMDRGGAYKQLLEA